jgi:diguanylate cyclase (GGDEF)-like protein/PAS domain S-box-containing protein
MLHYDRLPCPVLITDHHGRVVFINARCLAFLGGTPQSWMQQPMDALFPGASRIFLQTHVWPMLLRDKQVNEVRLQMYDAHKVSIPVLTNCQWSNVHGEDRYHWLFFVSNERASYEQALLEARQRADGLAARYARGEAFLRTVTNAVPNLIAYWDRDLRCQFSNQGYVDWFARSASDMQGINLHDLLGDAAFARSEAHVRGVLAGQAQEFEREFTKPDASVCFALEQYVPDLDRSGAVIGFYAVATDVTRLKEADAAIRLSASVFEATSEGVMVTDTAGAIVAVNPALCRITAYAEHEILGQSPRLMQSDRHEHGFYQTLWRVLLRTGQWKGEVWCRRKEGAVFLAGVSISGIRDRTGCLVRYVFVVSDVSDRHEKDERIRHMALHDGLTALPNRTLLMERLNQLLAIAARDPRGIAVLFLDLDGFKAINDRLGHDAGDGVLKTVAQRLQDALRATDTVARLGGDEFVILLDNAADFDAVTLVAKQVISRINEPMVFSGQEARVGMSIGIALHPVDGTTADELLKAADDAMYRAKASGKNTWRFLSDSENRR